MSEENQPLIGSTMALETRYEVRIQVLSSTPAERPPAMCGSETLAMLVSSTSMNVASVTVERDDPRIDGRRDVGVLDRKRRCGGFAHCTHTFGSTDIPRRSR